MMGELADGWSSVERWMSRLAPSTAKKNFEHLKWWLNWVRESKSRFAQFTPDELVSYQKAAGNGEQYDILDEIVQPYILSLEGRYSYKRRIYASLKSFFLHGRAELPRDITFSVKGDRQKVQGTLTLEELRNVILSCNPKYQAIYLSMFQGGMGREEFVYWNLNGWDELKTQLDQNVHPIKISLPGRKKARNIKPYYTMIGGDAIKAIRKYVDHERPPDSEKQAIFYARLGEPLGSYSLHEYWLRHLRKLGYALPLQKNKRYYRTGKNLHEFRDLFRSQWEKSSAKPSVAEYFMGHRVDIYEYNKAHRDEKWTRNEYLTAELMLNLMSSDTPFGKVDQDEVIQLRRELEDAKAGRTSEMEAMRTEIEELRKERRRDDVLMELLLDAAKENPDLIDSLLRRKAQET